MVRFKSRMAAFIGAAAGTAAVVAWRVMPWGGDFDTSGWAPGARVTAENVRWERLWDKYAVTLDLGFRSREGHIFMGAPAYLAICETMVDEMIAAPEGLAPNDVYRVNVARIGASNVHVPMEVRDGKCLSPALQDKVYPTYPEPLLDWLLIAFDPIYEQPDTGVVFTFLKRSAEGGEGVLPFEKACEAVLSERILDKRNLLDGYLEGKFLRVRFTAQRDYLIAQFASHATKDFNVRGGLCLPRDAGDKA